MHACACLYARVLAGLCTPVYKVEVGGKFVEQMEVIASRKNGCLLRSRSAPSKCDRLNVEWGSRDMWFRYDDTNPLNLAWRWQQWELKYPCPESERDRWPAFSPTGRIAMIAITGFAAQEAVTHLGVTSGAGAMFFNPPF